MLYPSMDYETAETAVIWVPRGNPGLKPMQFNLSTVQEAESRIQEIAFVTPQKAPELLALFNRAYLDLTRMLAFLGMELSSAERHVSFRRSTILLDLSKGILEKKGLTSSKDLRDAVIDSDLEYQELLERQQAIRAYEELLRGRAKALEMAYTSTKKVLGDRPMGGGRNPYVSDASPQTTTPVNTQQPGTNTSSRSGFAKPKYDF